MVVKISSKHQITIPKDIAEAFSLKKGDVLEVVIQGNKIVMVPKEVILRDKYPRKDLEGAENILAKELRGDEVVYQSGSDMIKALRKRKKK